MKLVDVGGDPPRALLEGTRDEIREVGRLLYSAVRLASAESAACPWQEDADGIWHTRCGHAHQFNDGGPVENHYRWCPYCGGAL